MDRIRAELRRRKAQDRALALLIAGAALLLPPFALLFHTNGLLFGLPATLVYIFVVWALLILGGRAVARDLRDRDGP